VNPTGATAPSSLSADSNRITTWEPDPDCTIGTKQGGSLAFRRRK
jgi:hypothetical protein